MRLSQLQQTKGEPMHIYIPTKIQEALGNSVLFSDKILDSLLYILRDLFGRRRSIADSMPN